MAKWREKRSSTALAADIDASMDAMTDPTAEAPWDEAYARRLLPSVLLAVVGFSMSMTIVSAALPTIAEDLHSSTQTLSWAVTGLFLAMAIGTPIMGRIGDIHGHRKVLLVGAAVLTIGTFLCAFAWSAATFIGARMIVGLGISATMPTSNALIMHAFPVSRRASAMGWYQMAMTGAPVIGLIVGGPVIEAWGWRPVFLAITPLALAGFILSAIVIRPSTPGPRVPIDWAGAATLGLATLGFLLGLERVRSEGPTSVSAVGLLVMGAVALVAFVAVEKRSPQPLLRLDYLRRRNFTGALVASALSQFAYMGGFLMSPLLLEEQFGLGVATTSLFLLFRPGVFSLSSPLGGRWASRLGERRLIMAGSGFLAISMVAFAGAAVAESLALVVAGLALSGLGMGLAAPAFPTAVAAAVDPADMGIATGMSSTMMNIGTLTGIQVMFVVLGDEHTRGAFATTYLFGAVAAVIGLLGAKVMRDGDPRAMFRTRSSPPAGGEAEAGSAAAAVGAAG